MSILFLLLLLSIALIGLICLGFLFRLQSNNKLYTPSSKLSAEEFIHQNKNVLHKLKIGCSFDPGEWSEEEIANNKPLEALKLLVEDLHIKDIRLGIRWNKVVDERNTIVYFDSFKPYLDYCIQQKVNICLNLGPIKTFRWPEEYIPEFAMRYHTSSNIRLNSKLAKIALQYLDNLIIFLKENYSKEELDYIRIIQPENEGFNRMGVLKAKMEEDYLREVISRIHTSFPKAYILINSAGRFNLRQITSFFQSFQKKIHSLHGKLVVGYDYYYKTEFRDKFVLSRMFDSIDFSLPTDLTVKKLSKKSCKQGFKIEITEAQFEPWGKLKGPGDSVNELKFMILKLQKHFSDISNNEDFVIRLWGIERYIKNLQQNPDQKDLDEIKYLIKSMNSL